MKSLLSKLLLLLALGVPWVTVGQQFGDHIVCRGTATDQYFPVYGYYVDALQHSQMIYPSDSLTSLQGMTITSLMFYAMTPATQLWGCDFVVKMGVTELETISTFADTGGLTTVYTGPLDGRNAVMEIELDVPFAYTSGNLMVDIHNLATGTYSQCVFYGANLSGRGLVGYSTYTPQDHNFLPKINFYCENMACRKPGEATVSDITSSSVTVSWPSVGSGSYRISAEGSTFTVYDTVYTFTNLEPNTSYTIGISAVCSEGVTSVPREVTFRTACGTIELPLHEGFEDNGTNLPFCWSLFENWTALNNQGFLVNTNATIAHDGQHFAQMVTQNGAVSIASPLMPIDPSDVEVFFWTQGMDNSTFEIGYVTSLDAGSTFHLVETVNVMNLMQKHYVSFASVEETSPIYVVFRAATGNAYVYLDDITIRESRSCRMPVGFSYVSSDDGSVTLDWNDAHNSGWQIAYGPVDCDPDSSTIIQNISSHPYTVENLQNDMIYDFYLRADCGTGESWWTDVVRAKPNTLLLPVSGTDTLYSCGMSIVDNGGVGGDYAANSNGTLILYPSSPDSTVRLSGVCNIGMGDNLYIYDGAERTRVLVGTYTGLATIDVVSTVGPLSVRFTSDNANNGSGFDLATTCEPKISCVEPYGLAVENIGVVSALVSWNYNPEGGAPYNYEVRTINGSTISTALSDTTFFQIEGLLPETAYSVEVRAVCQNGDTSAAITATFTTKSLPCGGSDLTQTQLEGEMNSTRYSTVLPSSSNYNNCITQQVYRVEELNGMGRITGMKIHTAGGNIARNLRVYLGTTPSVSLANFEVPSDQALVWTGTVGFAPDSVYTLNFDTPFSYSGSDNLLLTIIDYTGSYAFGNQTYVHSNANYYSRYAFNNNATMDAFNPPTTGTYQTTDRMDVIWIGNPCNASASCVAPIARVTDLSANSLSLHWTPGYTETSWKVEYREQGADTWTLLCASTTEKSQVVSGLAANTSYEFRVSSLCAAGDSPFTTLLVTTPCSQIVDFPFIEDFDDGFVATSATGSPFQSCWTRLCNAPYGAYPYLNTNMAYTGSKCLYFVSTSPSNYAVAVLPESSLPVDSLQLSLSLIRTGINYHITVGVMTDPEDFETFTQLATLSPAETNVWETFDINFLNYSGTGRYIALAIMGSNNYVGVDHLVLDRLPMCTRPSDIVVDTIVGTTATLHWTPTQATDYEIEYGPLGFAHGEGTLAYSETASVTLSGLAPSTMYEIYVRGNCGVTGYSEWSFASTFSTECGTIAALPYYENFNGWSHGSSPLCWDKGEEQFPWVTRYDDRFNNGCAYAFDFMFSPTAVRYVILPEIDSSLDLSELQVSMSLLATHPGGIAIGTCSRVGEIASFVPIDSAHHTGDGEWQDFEIPLSNYAGSSRILALKAYLNYELGSTITMDEFKIDFIPTCPSPDSLRAAEATNNSVVLSWFDRAGASQWQVEYGIYDPSTQQIIPSTTQQIIASSNPFTLGGLTPSTMYVYRVRPVCSATDTGDWSRLSCRFNTAQVPATVPYSYDFETGDEWGNWDLLNDFEDISWSRGTADAAAGSYSMYISTDNGATVSTHGYQEMGPFQIFHPNMTAYRDFDFGANDTNITLRFMAKCGGIPASENDKLAVFMVDPTQTYEVFSTLATTPWGDLTQVDVAATVHCDTTWQTYETEFARVHGVKRIVFFYCNDYAGSDLYVGDPAEVDNIQVFAAECPRPADVEVVSATSTTMDVTWWGDASAQYEVRYAHYADPESVTVVPASTNSITLTGLVASSQYYIGVRKICGEGDTSIFTDNIIGRTECLDGVISTFPWVEDFEAGLYCWAQQQLVGINEWKSTNRYQGNIPYEGNSFAVIEHRNRNDKTMLVSPVMSITEGAYMTFAHIQAAWGVDQDTLGVYYRTSESSDWVYIFSYTNNITNWVVDSLALPNPSNTYQIGFMAFDNYGYGVAIDKVTVYSDGCPAPLLDTVAVTYNSIDVAWSGAGDNYEVSYKTLFDADYCAPISVTGTSYSFSHLMPATQYSVRVRLLCDEENASDWVAMDVVTDELPCPTPTNLHQTELTYTSVTLDWTNGGEEELWVVKVFNGRIGEILDTVDTHPVTIEGLASGEGYFATVQSACGSNLEGFSSWSDTINFTTADCVPVVNLACGTVTEEEVLISWNSNGSESSWLIEYGTPGFGQGEALGSVVTETNTYALSLAGLAPNTDYEVYVYAQCAEGISSIPTGPAAFRTGNIGIPQLNNSTNQQINLYPNPASGSFTISISSQLLAHSSQLNIEIVDMNGRKVMRSVMEGAGEKEIAIEGLAQGAYFVRIYGEEINSIRKLIVR